jgi:hypothetical protein
MLSELKALREAGWVVAVHNDYRLKGEAHTFWLFTHPDGRWIKGEGQTDDVAIRQALDAARTEPSSPVGEVDGLIALLREYAQSAMYTSLEGDTTEVTCAILAEAADTLEALDHECQASMSEIAHERARATKAESERDELLRVVGEVKEKASALLRSIDEMDPEHWHCSTVAYADLANAIDAVAQGCGTPSGAAAGSQPENSASAAEAVSQEDGR